MKTKEEIATYMREYRRKNLDRIRRYQRLWWYANADRVNAKRRARYYLDPEFRKYDIERHKKQHEESK